MDLQTLFSSAEFLEGQTIEQVWSSLVSCWASFYIGFPNKLHVDQGNAFTSPRWKKLARSVGITMKYSGVESRNSLGAGERYHGPLRRIFQKIKKDTPKVSDSYALRLAVHAMNSTMGPEGLTPTLLVFGVQPRFPFMNTDLPQQRDRREALKNAGTEMEQITSEQRIHIALKKKLPQCV